MPKAKQRDDVPTRGFLMKAERWLYPGGRPNGLARLLNRGWAIVHATGLLPQRFVTLQVPGRRTGRMLSFPLVMADYQGEWYLVAMLGERSNWLRNVRAAGGRAVLRHGRRETVCLEEVDPDARAPIVRRYLSLDATLPGMRGRRAGRVINVGSLASWVGEPGEAFYAASKAALAAYSESLRHEVWPLGIHVSVVEPGAFRTNVLQQSTTSDGTIPDYDAARRVVRETLHTALRRGDDPRKAARTIFKVAGARSPRLRYTAGGERWLPYLRVLMPQRLFDRLLRREYGLTDISHHTT